MRKVTALLIVLLLCALVVPAFAAKSTIGELINTPADNLLFENFSPYAGTELGPDQVVANGWTPFTLQDTNKYIKFFKDLPDRTATDTKDWVHTTNPTNYYVSGPDSTGAFSIACGRYLYHYMFNPPYEEDFGAAGFHRVVNVTPGKVYMYHGYMDFWPSSIGQAYRPMLGINTTGATAINPAAAPGILKWVPAAGTYLPNVGDAKWGLGNGAAFQYDTSSNFSLQSVSSMYPCAAAWPAEASSISLWHGVVIRDNGGGNQGTNPTPLPAAPVWDGDHFENDSFALHEFSFIDTNDPEVTNKCYNGNFDGETLTIKNAINGTAVDYYGTTQTYPGWQIPDGWVPIGGGLGMYYSWKVDTEASTGNKYATFYNRRGMNYFGLMQKVRFNTADPNPTSFKLWVSCQAKIDSRGDITNPGGAWASFGFDPNGGSNPFAPSVIWADTQSQTFTNLSLQVQATANNQVGTIFLIGRNCDVNGKFLGTEHNSYHIANFDSVQFKAFAGDTTPPDDFTVSFYNTAGTAVTSQDETHHLIFKESIVPADAESGVVSNAYWIGTTPGASNILGRTEVGINQKDFEVFDVDMANGTVYVTCEVTNGVGLKRTKTGSVTINAAANALAWSAKEHVSFSMSHCDSPTIACGPDGSVYLAYRNSDGKATTADPVNGIFNNTPSWAGFSGKIAFKKRPAGGSWGETKTVASTSAVDGYWDPALAVNKLNGSITMLYTSPGSYANNNLYKITSTDGGASWSSAATFDLGTNKMLGWFSKPSFDKNGSLLISANRVDKYAGGAGNPPSDINYEPVIIRDGQGFEAIPGATVNSDRGRTSPSIVTDKNAYIYNLWDDGSGKLDKREGCGE